MGQVKVKSVGIQLALIDDVKKQYDAVQTARSNASSSLKAAESVGSAIALDAKSLRARAEEFLGTYDKFVGMAKGLGVDVPANIANLNTFAKGDLKLADQLTKAGATIQSLAKG